MSHATVILQSLLAASLFLHPDRAIQHRWVVERSSCLYIEGRSNVNNFRCDVLEYLRPDTIVFYQDRPEQQNFMLKGGIAIDIYRFDCHHRYITADLRKTLKAGETDQLKITLLSMSRFEPSSIGQHVKGCVVIELAGAKQIMDISYIVQGNDNGDLHLYGEKQVMLSDFSLMPPKKMGGLIRVQPSIDVHFQLVLRAINS
ncbi:MAG: hypothetical protein JST39_13560 [Bacteroidetes bacterium]|nr:hypothetical protein [Bacteroidota bacterium]